MQKSHSYILLLLVGLFIGSTYQVTVKSFLASHATINTAAQTDVATDTKKIALEILSETESKIDRLFD